MKLSICWQNKEYCMTVIPGSSALEIVAWKGRRALEKKGGDTKWHLNSHVDQATHIHCVLIHAHATTQNGQTRQNIPRVSRSFFIFLYFLLHLFIHWVMANLVKYWLKKVMRCAIWIQKYTSVVCYHPTLYLSSRFVTRDRMEQSNFLSYLPLNKNVNNPYWFWLQPNKFEHGFYNKCIFTKIKSIQAT